MRLSITLLGTEVFVVEFGTPEQADDEELSDAGSFTSYPVGFVRDIAPDWDVPGSYHQFDPSEDSEDV